ncbi:hypothetical protein FRC08_006202 [Ceratobasidium sp. 394]|nr:hypothetical protein FRC08_006202 [Ceratobasidium sp. 394]KAG9085310.1 hypothetical protein FS749_004536 [Ceratobasidium sp. UAMH 11750]
MASSGKTKSYMVKELTPEGRHMFSRVEEEWLASTYMQEFCQLVGKKMVPSKDLKQPGK